MQYRNSQRDVLNHKKHNATVGGLSIDMLGRRIGPFHEIVIESYTSRGQR